MTTQTLDPIQSDVQPRPWWLLPSLLVVVAVIALLAYGLFANSRGRQIDGPAPDFTLQSFDGETYQLSELRGRPVVLNFWASWCLECDKEMPILQQSYQRYQDEVLFLGVAWVDTREKSIAYLERFGTTYPNGPDLGSRIANDYKIKGVPETFFIDRDGTLRGVHVGPLSESDLEGWLQKLTRE